MSSSSAPDETTDITGESSQTDSSSGDSTEPGEATNLPEESSSTAPGEPAQTSEPAVTPPEAPSETTQTADTEPGSSTAVPQPPAAIGFSEYTVPELALNAGTDASGLWQRWPNMISIPATYGTDLSRYEGRPADSEALNGITVILDPGHGGRDPGAIGKVGDGVEIYEKDLNLAVALEAKTYLESLGAEVIMTRTDDSWTSLYRRVAIAGFEAADYWKRGLQLKGLSTAWIDSIRGELQHQYNANDDQAETGGRGFSQGMGAQPLLRQLLDAQGMMKHTIYVSIHANSADEAAQAKRGLQIYISTNQSVYESELAMIQAAPSDPEVQPIHPNYTGYDDISRLQLANRLYESVSELAPDLKQPGTAVFGGNYAFLRELNYTAALVEMGFMSNPEDLAVLLDPASQDAIAQGIANGIYRYFCG